MTTTTQTVKRDCRTGEIIRSGQAYRTLYPGTALECYSLVREYDESMRHDAQVIGGTLPDVEIAE